MLGSKSYDELRRELLTTRDANGGSTKLFNDPAFPPKMTSLFKDGRPPPSFPYHPTQIVWKRPRELVNDPKFVVDGFNPHDVDQGQLGDCWFLAAAAVLAKSHKHEFERVVPKDHGFKKEYTGMFRFNFWWYGKWVEVIIDDYLPTVNDKLIYCNNTLRPDEFWPCLLEKAYAKLKGTYGELHGGRMEDALLDITGGKIEVIGLGQENDVSPELYSQLKTSHMRKTIMGGTIFKPPQQQQERQGVSGDIVHKKSKSSK